MLGRLDAWMLGLVPVGAPFQDAVVASLRAEIPAMKRVYERKK